MSVCCGMIGLPNVGKTTVFNALVGAGGLVANYPFATVETNVGISAVPDPRLKRLVEIFHSKKMTPGTLEVRDIAGLVQGASQGEGLGNQFLGQIREVDLLLHLVRCFPDPNVVHVIGEVDPVRDIEIIESELMLADLGMLERRRERLDKRIRAGDGEAKKELAFILRLEELLNQGSWLFGHPFSPDEWTQLKDFQLLSAKPMCYVANILEGGGLDDPHVQAVVRHAERSGARSIVLSGKIESELATLPEEERMEFLKELGMEESGLQRLLAVAYELLGLITFFTAGEEESRAWTISQGMTAQDAAGKIHTDMSRGFIRAEVFSYSDLLACGSQAAVKEKGLFRLEGRDYLVKDGDIMYFRFNV